MKINLERNIKRPLLYAILLLSAVPAINAQPVRVAIPTPFTQTDGSSPRGNLVLGLDGNFYGTTYGGLSGIGTVFRLTTNGDLTTLAYFNGGNGAYPNSLVLGNDGNFYGTCAGGVAGDFFQVTPAGTVTAWFPFGSSFGSQPEGALTLGADGEFYGVTANGGTFSGGVGTAFKVTTNGVVSTLVSFSYAGGYSPYAGLTLGNDGSFYGTTYEGGFAGGGGYGTVFKLTPDGALTHIVAFTRDNGANPMASLIQGPDGGFYGTTSAGGSGGKGTIFHVTPDGALTTLASLDGTNGSSPQANLTLGGDGNFYGTTSGGGSNGLGTIFRVTTNGVLTTLVAFAGTNGASPLGGLTIGNDGLFYGTTSAGGSGGFGTAFRVTPDGTLTTLAVFTGGKGRNPGNSLTLAGDGNLYGTTYSGGDSDQGTFFQVTATDTFVPLSSFRGTNGANPAAGMVWGTDGNLYGTTYSGGSSIKGTVFRVTTSGVLTTLISFAGTNGANPQGSLAQGNDGSFYGTTYGGGTSGQGTVFRVTIDGLLTRLASFAGTNGANPQAGLAQGNDGNFYGTTYSGGSGGVGTVFRVTPQGVLTGLISFAGATGYNPQASLVLGNDGNLYGTTTRGGGSGRGTVFRVTTNGVLTTLVSFTGSAYLGANGATPRAALTLGSDGNFYGTTYEGGANSQGTVFRITTNGVFTSLLDFAGSSGATPQAGLTLGSNGDFYGATSGGGSNGMGVVFRLGIPPSITIQPASVTVLAENQASLGAGVAGTPLNYQWYMSSGRTAAALAVLGGTQVQSAVISDGGVGYSTAPQVQFIGGGGGGAGGAALVENGMVTAINITNKGFYFSTAPTIQIENPPSTLVPLLNETNSTLSFSSVVDANATNYFVVVTNSYGSVTSAMVGLVVALPPQKFSATMVETGLQLQLTGTPGYPYILQATTNLLPPITWSSVLTNPADSGGRWSFIDTNLVDLQKFYRAKGQ